MILLFILLLLDSYTKDIIGDVLGPFGNLQLRAVFLVFVKSKNNSKTSYNSRCKPTSSLKAPIVRGNQWKYFTENK